MSDAEKRFQRECKVTCSLCGSTVTVAIYADVLLDQDASDVELDERLRALVWDPATADGDLCPDCAS